MPDAFEEVTRPRLDRAVPGSHPIGTDCIRYLAPRGDGR